MAKGLEWPAVALAGLEEGLFPLGRTAGEPGGLEEERRLCYVGLTRAREKLYLSWARTRYRHGRLELSEPSRFLEALPPHVVAERSTTPLWDRDRTGTGRTAGWRGAWGATHRTPALRNARRARSVRRSGAAGSAPLPDGRARAASQVRRRSRPGGLGMGRDLKVTVAFDEPTSAPKQLLAAYAGLERDWEGA